MPTDPKTPGPNTTGIRVGSSRIPSTTTRNGLGGVKRDSTVAELDPSSSTVKKPFPFPTPRSGLGPSASLSSLPARSSLSSGSGSSAGAAAGAFTTPRPSSSLSLTTPKPSQTPSSRLSSTLSVSALQRQVLLLQTSKAELEGKLRERDGKVERLERDRRVFLDRERELTEEWGKERGELEGEKKDLQSKLTTLRTQHTALEEDLADVESAQSQLKSQLSSSTAHQKALIDSLNSRIAFLEEEKGLLERTNAEQDRSLAELKIELERATSSNSSNSLSSSTMNKKEDEDSTILTAELSRLTTHLRTLETTNSRLSSEVSMLRERHASIEVLREENRGLKAKVEKVEEMRVGMARLEAELDEARSALASSHSLSSRPTTSPNSSLSTSSTSLSPGEISIDLTTQLTTLRLAHAQLTSTHGETSALLKQREEELRTMEEREVELRVRLEEVMGEKEGLEGRVRRAEADVRVGEREVGFLGEMVRRLTSASEDEQQVPLESGMEGVEGSAPDAGLSLSQSQLGRSSSGVVAAQAERIKHLETLLEEAKERNEELRREVGALGGDVGSLGRGKTREVLVREVEDGLEKIRRLESELAATTTSLKSHEDKIESLEQTLFELSGEIAGGRHVPPGVRVLSLADNPEERWFEGRREVLERMRGENEGLMRRVGELERALARSSPGDATTVGDGSAGVDGEGAEGNGGKNGEGEGRQGGAGKGMVPRESWELVCREKEELEEEVKAKEKRLRRLKEIFNSKGAEFRDAIASILGVKLAFFPNGDVRVTSVYDLTTSFVFQAAKKGRATDSSAAANGGGAVMQLVAQGEGGPANLPETMRYWIEEEQCIPGFMASVTLECYDGWKTQAREGGEMDE